MTINPQEAHYEAIHDAYAAHYYDSTSMDYRREFLLGPMLKGVNLTGARVADIACGSGQNSQLLKERFPTARFEGFDISPTACEDYRLAVGAPAHQADLTVPMGHTEPFDAALVVGGLHHCISNLPEAVSNITRLVRPGGTLMLCEPNAKFIAERARKLWYKADKYFEEETEAAIEPGHLARLFAEFDVEKSFTVGGPAYFGILNSLVLRIPLASKRFIAPPLFVAERVWNAIPISALKPAFCMVLRRR